MSNIPAMFSAIEFIENNLRTEIGVADVADAVSYSLYHFCRMFNRLVHHTPYDYLMRRRLSESARELAATDKKIIDIALEYQFGSPETYSRAFKRMFGVQPYEWKRRGGPGGRPLMTRLTLRHLEHINQGDYLRPVLEERGAFRVAGLMSLVKDDPQVPAQLWAMLGQELAGMVDTSAPRDYYGIAWYPPGWKQHGHLYHLYMAAVRVEDGETPGGALVTKRMPQSKYARFIHKGLYPDLGLTRDYIYQTWLPQSGQRLAGPFEIESYGQDFGGPGSQASEWEIYIPIE
jgi:AraC family transcriptional regulator